MDYIHWYIASQRTLPIVGVLLSRREEEEEEEERNIFWLLSYMCALPSSSIILILLFQLPDSIKYLEMERFPTRKDNHHYYNTAVIGFFLALIFSLSSLSVGVPLNCIPQH